MPLTTNEAVSGVHGVEYAFDDDVTVAMPRSLLLHLLAECAREGEVSRLEIVELDAEDWWVWT